MASRTEERRRDLRARLVDIAERHIAERGLSGLRARDLASEAGCALGAIYTVAGDLNDIVLEVNARTFRRLGAEVADTLATAPADPARRLVVMSRAYHRFAAANRHLWRALFDLDRPETETAPEWYLAEMGHLFALIDGPVATLFPDFPGDERNLLVRALFSAVHGIVLLAVERATAGLPEDEVDRMLGVVLARITGRPDPF